jgi:hypothetical protein
MATPPLASAALITSEADLAALQATANQNFIDQAVAAISNAQAQGQQVVYMTTFQYCDFNYLATYFQQKGYTVVFPDYAPSNGAQPAGLFGPDWVAYWQNQLIPTGLKPQNPIRMGFAWSLPTA